MIRREGARGVVWYVKWCDADGRQVKERVGREDEGVTRDQAVRVLEDRLSDVRRRGLRRPPRMAFCDLVDEWLATYPDSRALKQSTREGYETILRRHLEPVFGATRVDAIDSAAIERYVALKRRDGYAPASIVRHLNLLHEVFVFAEKHGRVTRNPVAGVDRPREPRRRWKILSPAEIARVERAFDQLAAEAASEPERAWRAQARVVFVLLVGAGLRRGELLGLRWRDVALADPDGPRIRVRETVVRGRQETPKSEAGERTIAIGPRLAEELFQHRARTAYASDADRVFCHPEKGSVLDHKRYARSLELALELAGVEGRMRPFHDSRHTAITNDAAAGNSPLAVMKRAGHSDFKTTQAYIDLAGETFRAEAERLERRLFGGFEEPAARDAIEADAD